jgi:hypothetical protein
MEQSFHNVKDYDRLMRIDRFPRLVVLVATALPESKAALGRIFPMPEWLRCGWLR